MSNINRRLKKIEKAINVHEEKKIVEIVMFCSGELPAEYTHGNITIRHVRYDDICTK